MAMKLLEAKRAGVTFCYRIWLDTTKIMAGVPAQPDGSIPEVPDPAYVYEETFSTEERQVAGGETAAAFTARLVTMHGVFRDLAKYHATAQLAAMGEAALPGEGDPL
jgi:hypothetical protein